MVRHRAGVRQRWWSELGLPDAAELDTKVRLAVTVNRLLESRRLTQAAAAAALSINQPKISALKHYKLEEFSVQRLMTFLTALGSTALGSDIARYRNPRSFAETIFLARNNFGQCRLSG
jgi:predicted XRE-type DNA-binding protein